MQTPMQGGPTSGPNSAQPVAHTGAGAGTGTGSGAPYQGTGGATHAGTGAPIHSGNPV